MPNKKAEFIRFNTIKEYINDILKMRSSESAVKLSMKEFDSAIETVLKEAGKLAKEDNRNTVMDQDIISAVEKHLGKRHLTWQETAEEIIRQNPADLGKISKTINDYIEEEQKRRSMTGENITINQVKGLEDRLKKIENYIKALEGLTPGSDRTSPTIKASKKEGNTEK